MHGDDDDAGAPPQAARPRTTRAIADLHDRTAPALEALSAIVAGHAKRRAGDLVPAGLESDAAALLEAACRILGREPGWRPLLALRAPPVWAELEAKLALAEVGLRRFKRRHYAYDEALGAYRWQVHGRPPHPAAPPYAERNVGLVGRAKAALARQLDDFERDH